MDYKPSTEVKVGDDVKHWGKVTKVRKHTSKNLLGGEISVITFTFENGDQYTASAEWWSPEDIELN